MALVLILLQRLVCASKDSWAVILDIVIIGGLCYWEVVTVKDEKVFDASPLSLWCHKSPNVTYSILSNHHPHHIYSITSIWLHRIWPHPNFLKSNPQNIINICEHILCGSTFCNLPMKTCFFKYSDSFRQEIYLFFFSLWVLLFFMSLVKKDEY